MAFIDTKGNDESVASIKVYPNPTNYAVSIEVPYTDKEVDTYSIYSMNGTLVKVGEASSSNNTISLDLSDLNNGIYLIKIDGVDGFVKVIKQ
jgi:poly(beta-D-mannuronate) lyase